MRILNLLVFVVSVIGLDLSFKPNYYEHGDKVDLLVNKIESDHTQLPYSYYSLPFVCPRTQDTKAIPMSLGAILRGDRLWESNYQLRFGIDMPCMRLCDLIANEKGLDRATQLIRDGYVVQWAVDGLPGATTFLSQHNNKYYAAGYSLGFVEKDVAYIHNHAMIVIRWHRERKTRKNTIVGFEVYPKSVSDESCPGASKDYKNLPVSSYTKQIEAAKAEGTVFKQRIPWTYSVYWREDTSVDYSLRWDMYYENESNTNNHKIHWLSVVNALVLVGFLSLIVAIVLVKVLKKDIQSQHILEEEDKSSWRTLSNEVSKSPRWALLLTLFVANGTQMLVACLGVIGISVFNTKLGSMHQGSVYLVSIFFFVTSGAVSSYVGVILHKLFHNGQINTEYKVRSAVSLSIIFSGTVPAAVFGIVLFLNFFVWAKQSSYALPLGTIVVLILLFLAIEIPLGIMGGILGNKRKAAADSVLNSGSGSIEKKPFSLKQKTTDYIRILTTRSWIHNPILSTAIFGLIPFSIVYVELAFVFNSIWFEKTTFYYMYGFLFVTVILLVAIVIESTIIAVYISLAVYNNPSWQWLSFRVGSSVGVYIYLYSIFYFVVYLDVNDFLSGVLYFTYMGIACSLLAITFGAVASITGLTFIKNIYGAVKMD